MSWWANQILKEVSKPRDRTTGIRRYVGVSSQEQTFGLQIGP